MIEEICEHSMDTALLQPGAKVLDVGCRSFDLPRELQRRFAARVYCVDIDELDTDQAYYRCAIAGTEGRCGIVLTEDKQARHIRPGGDEITQHTLMSFSNRVGVAHWDLIKLDCEGAEYDILKGLWAPPATQISVEFHQHTQFARSAAELQALFEHLARWYDCVKKVYEPRHGCCANYWDCLFIQRCPPTP